MIGFLIGTASLIGLVKTLRRGRGFGGYGGGCHGHHGHHGGRGSYGRRGMLRLVFERLDTTPGQEKVILAAIDDVRAAGQTARGEWKRARADVATAVRGDTVDEPRLAEASARLDAAGQTLREAVSVGLTKIHEVLEPDQRRRLADMIDDGPGFFDRFAGPYRGGWEALAMRRKLLIALFAFGTVAGFGWEVARFRHHGCGGARWEERGARMGMEGRHGWHGEGRRARAQTGAGAVPMPEPGAPAQAGE